MEAVDVLVVGLGPAGAAAAYRAAAAGLSVLAIDKKKRIGEPVQCAEFVPTPLMKYTQGAGVLIQRVTGMKSFLPSGAVEKSSFPGLMVDRAAFDRALAQQARAAGAQICTETRLSRLQRQAAVLGVGEIKQVDATAADIADIEQAGYGLRTIQYKVLIAGDGPHSGVARLLNLPDLSLVLTRQYTVSLRRAYDDTDIWLSDEFPGGYGWLFPKGELANVGLGADRRYEANLKIPLERLHAHLVALGLVGREISARTGGAIPVGGMRASLVHGNILFAGDAAGLTHPITGAGIAAAVVSGEHAGNAAAEFVKTGDAQALWDYDADMRDQYETTLVRAVARRAALEACWRKPAAQDDGVMRRGWIAFEEYFAA